MHANGVGVHRPPCLRLRVILRIGSGSGSIGRGGGRSVTGYVGIQMTFAEIGDA